MRPASEAEAARARRVTILTLAAAALGVLDLAFTLTYARSIGMLELNPLARSMIDLGGAGQLVRFKLFTIALSSGALYLTRRERGAELAAWASVAVLVGLGAHWVRYTTMTEELGPVLVAHATPADHRWVVIAED
ncbi:MAG: hypothetical protein D6693_02750 [Planctomycetota bacterium]|nr:MAG: hypothetical protein D6693_02750 [Planctomycetota bacterium]